VNRFLFVMASEQPKPCLPIVGETIRILADATQTGGPEFFEQFGPEGSGPPPHTHPWDESFFIVEGMLDFVAGDETVLLGPGSLVHVPAGTVHAFRYRTDGRMFSVTSSKGAADFFQDLAAKLPDGSISIPVIVSTAAAHGLHLVLLPPR
jgi:mannose-6-phosphate isomerase-like protein (cupin superfamily)